MVKIAITCTVLLVLCQLAAARSFVDEEQFLNEVAPRGDETSIDCARELTLTLRTYYAKFTNTIKTRGNALLEFRRGCEALTNPTDISVCWVRYQAQIIFVISDVLEAFRNRAAIFDRYANIVLENYYECRSAEDQNEDNIDDVLLELLGDLQADIALLTSPMEDVDCAMELKDSVIEIYEEIAKNIYGRLNAVQAIRRRCQLTEDAAEQRSCWWEFRIQVLFGITDSIRDFRSRRENFDRVTLGLLNAYYACRTQ